MSLTSKTGLTLTITGGGGSATVAGMSLLQEINDNAAAYGLMITGVIGFLGILIQFLNAREIRRHNREVEKITRKGGEKSPPKKNKS